MYFILPSRQDSNARNRSLKNCLSARSTRPAVRTARNMDTVKVRNPGHNSAYVLSSDVTHTEPLYSPQNFRRQIPHITEADDFLSPRYVGFTDSEKTAHSTELIPGDAGNRSVSAGDPHSGSSGMSRVQVQVQCDDTLILTAEVDLENNRGRDQEQERSNDAVEAPRHEKDSQKFLSDCDVDSADGVHKEIRIEGKEKKRRSAVRRPSIIRVDFNMGTLESEELRGTGAIKGEGNEEEKLLIAQQLEQEAATEVEPSEGMKERRPTRGDEHDRKTIVNGEKESVRFHIPDTFPNVSHVEGGGGGSSVHFSNLASGEGLGKHLDAENVEHFDDVRKTKRLQTLRSPTRTKSKDGLLELHLPELTYKTDTLVIPRSRYTGLVVEGQSQHRCVSPGSYSAGRDKGTDERVGGDYPVSASPQIHSPDCSSPSEARRGRWSQYATECCPD